MEFIKWPKIKRFPAGMFCVVTEKIDGTNACIAIDEDGKLSHVQSRSRVLSVENDNHGLCKWATENKEEVELLGPGYHFGEWAGPKINRNRHQLTENKFYLFPTNKWLPRILSGDDSDYWPFPAGVQTVPLLYSGTYSDGLMLELMDKLKNSREYDPEGLVLFFPEMGGSLKFKFDDDCFS